MKLQILTFAALTVSLPALANVEGPSQGYLKNFNDEKVSFENHQVWQIQVMKPSQIQILRELEDV
jgi:hypothetical protein